MRLGVKMILQSVETKKDACASFLQLVPRAGVEPARMFSPRDFKSLVSTNFTTWAINFCCCQVADNGANYIEFAA